MLMPNERLDDLGDGYRIIQCPDEFCFGIDAVLLARFAHLHAGERVADLCAGGGIVSILLCKRTPVFHIDAYEIQLSAAERAARSMFLNRLEERVSVFCRDVREIKGVRYDALVCNPPYLPLGRGEQSQSGAQRAARFEVCLTLSELAQACARLLGSGGRLYLIHRAQRAAEIMRSLSERGIEPKRARLVQSAPEKPAQFILIQGVRDAKPGLIFDPTLTL